MRLNPYVESPFAKNKSRSICVPEAGSASPSCAEPCEAFETQLQVSAPVAEEYHSLDVPALVGGDAEPAVRGVRGRAVRREPVHQLRLSTRYPPKRKFEISNLGSTR